MVSFSWRFHLGRVMESSMNEQTRSAIEAALAMSAEERTILVEALLGSLSEEDETREDSELVAELDRRRADAGLRTDSIPWSTLSDEM
jgi:putative addiction module component (TIGR02574 family)